MDIRFGTDGWRAVIGDGYTFDNLGRVSAATARWVLAQGADATADGGPSVLIGYDTRFQGEAFAQHAARVFATAGIRVVLSDGFATTPAVSWGTAEGGHAAGIVITASHNPPAYNGFKIKSAFGGPASPEVIAEVEAELPNVGEVAAEPFDALVEQGRIERFDLQGAYTELLRERIDVEAIKESGKRVAYDAMFGAGQGIPSELLGRTKVTQLHHGLNPGMLGQAPEPIERNLAALMTAVVDNNCAAGLATDGDADRIGLVDEEGQFVDSHKILALLVKYLHTEKDLRGTIVKTFSTTDMLDRMGEAYGLPVVTTPIGFKHIGPMMTDGSVLVGGEESGGMAVMGHIPERDGLYIGMTVVEMMVKRERSLSGLVRELMDEFGPHYQSRSDLHTTDARKQAVLEELKTTGFSEVDGQAVTKSEDLDGYKFRVEGGWLMFRPSGTEPVLRIYSEATSQDAADALVAWGVGYVEGGA